MATPFTLSDYYTLQPREQAKIREIVSGTTTGAGDIGAFADQFQYLTPDVLKRIGVVPPGARAGVPEPPTPGSAFNVGAPQTFTPAAQPAMLPALAGGGAPAMGGGMGMPASANPWMSLLAQLGGMGMMGGGFGQGGMGFRPPPMGGQMMGAGAPMPLQMGQFGGFPSLLMGQGMGGQAGSTRKLLMDRLFGGAGQPGATPGTFTG